ncbi:hypothetical protein APHAL10511_001117 [Amanita phalloides]|nr:hypothetical protein APHAL10511_001117 [Amanita phalloides]
MVDSFESFSITPDAQSESLPVIKIATEEHVRHVTIRQITGAERKHKTAPLTIEGHEVSAVMIVANIFGCVKDDDGALEFSLDDGTGRIKCSTGNQKLSRLGFGHFAYVRVVGTVTQPRSREVKYLKAICLTEITDPHEIFYHNMKVIETSLQLAALRNGPPMISTELPNSQDNSLLEEDLHSFRESNPVSETSMRGSADDHQSSHTGNYGELERDDWFSSISGTARTVSSGTTASYYTAYSQRSPSPESTSTEVASPHEIYDDSCFPSHMGQPSRARIHDPYENLDNFQRDIILCISNALELCARPDRYDNGVNIRVIVQHLRAKHGPRANDREIVTAIEYLIDEAYIYTTIDDEHYNVVLM